MIGGSDSPALHSLCVTSRQERRRAWLPTATLSAPHIAVTGVLRGTRGAGAYYLRSARTPNLVGAEDRARTHLVGEASLFVILVRPCPWGCVGRPRPAAARPKLRHSFTPASLPSPCASPWRLGAMRSCEAVRMSFSCASPRWWGSIVATVADPSVAGAPRCSSRGAA